MRNRNSPSGCSTAKGTGDCCSTISTRFSDPASSATVSATAMIGIS